MSTTTMEPTTRDREMNLQQKQEVTGAELTHAETFFTPAVDIFETEAAITVTADMPGVTADGLTIDLRDNVLTIEGRVKPATNDNEHVLLREYRTGGFTREFKLTNLIDQKRIDARLTDGVLRLTLPKAERARPRKIEVKAG